jgi:hypothetical protein
MIPRVIVALLLFFAALCVPGFVVALGAGNWPLVLLYGLSGIMFIGMAVLYSMLVVSGWNAEQEGKHHD